MGVLYEHWRPDLNECFYVGASWANPETRPYEMSGRNDDHIRIQEELAAKGSAPEVKVIDCSWLCDEELGELESLQIAYWRDFIGDRLVNRAKGGEGFNIDWDADMRERHKVWRKNFISSENGKVWSENHSEFMDGYWNGENGERNRNAHSALKTSYYETEAGKECIERIRETVKAIVSTDEWRDAERKRKEEFYVTEEGKRVCEQISESLISFYQTPEGQALSSQKSEQMLYFVSTPEGESWVKSLSEKRTEFLKTPEGASWSENHGIKHSEFYASEAGRVCKDKQREKMEEFYESDEGKIWSAQNSAMVTGLWAKPEYRAKMMYRDWDNSNKRHQKYWGA